MGEERVGLEHGVDAALPDGDRVDALTAQRDLAGIGRLKSRDAPEQSGLATAGWPEEHHEQSICDVEADVVEGPDLAALGRSEGLAHPLHAQRRDGLSGHRSSLTTGVDPALD